MYPRQDKTKQLDMADEWLETTGSLLSDIMSEVYTDYMDVEDKSPEEAISEDLDLDIDEIQDMAYPDSAANISLKAFAYILFLKGYRVSIAPKEVIDNNAFSGTISAPIYNDWKPTCTLSFNEENKTVSVECDDDESKCCGKCHCHKNNEDIEEEIDVNDPDIQDFLSRMREVVNNNNDLKVQIKSIFTN